MKIIVLISVLFLLCGCTNVNQKVDKNNLDNTFNNLVINITESKYEIYNNYKTGYKYYTPSNLDVIDGEDYNEIIASSKYRYYLYVDVVSYYNRVIENYEENPMALYSKSINNKDKFGYIEINEASNGRYLLEIMYNYAKIEVIVDENSINEALASSLVVLSSVKYNNIVLKNLIGEDVLTSKEIEFNIFETKKTESNFLELEQNNDYVEEIKDPDLIN